jgi:hypothetical protein
LPSALAVTAPGLIEELSYPAEVLTALYPPPHVVGRAGTPTSMPDGHLLVASYRAVPPLGRPRLLVPAHPPSTAARVLRHAAPPGTRLQRLVVTAAKRALAIPGVAPVALRRALAISGPAGGDTFAAYVQERLGQGLSLVVHVGSPDRPNRKPVVQLVDSGGAPVAFAKLGASRLAKRLVAEERDALRALGSVPLRHVTVPALLHHGQWNSQEVLVESALPLWRAQGSAGTARLEQAMIEVAGIFGIRRVPLSESGYLVAVLDRLRAFDDDRDAQGVSEVATRLLAAHGGLELEFGAWHGDWSPWNIRATRDTVFVWDWERFASGVPVGFDALHLWLRPAVQDPASGAAGGLLRMAPKLLAPFGVAAQEAVLTGLLFLVELATRHLEDRRTAGGPGMAQSHWVLPVLTAALRSGSADSW